MAGWQASAPEIDVEHPELASALVLSSRDLGARRIVDNEHPDDDVVAASAPWFRALVGRDSLLTSSMMMPSFPNWRAGRCGRWRGCRALGWTRCPRSNRVESWCRLPAEVVSAAS
jgi:hypothetical protein